MINDVHMLHSPSLSAQEKTWRSENDITSCYFVDCDLNEEKVIFRTCRQSDVLNLK